MEVFNLFSIWVTVWTDRMAVCCDGGLLPIVYSIWVSVQTQTEWLYVVMEVFNLFTIWVTVWTDRMAVCCDGGL